MTEQDAFLTHAIVGAPLSVELGRRALDMGGSGLELDAARGEVRLSPAWQPWGLEHSSSTSAQQVDEPVSPSTPWRRALEQHALPIAGLGLVALAAGTAMVILAGSRLW